MTPRPTVATLRIVIAALAGTIAGIHLDLWNGHGYRHVPTIGPLFLLNGISGALLAIMSILVPAPVLPFIWIAVTGYATATLAAVLVSLNSGLFGFIETTTAPLLIPSICVEASAIATAAAAAGLLLVTGRRRASAERARRR